MLPHLVMPAHHDVRPRRCDDPPAARRARGGGRPRAGRFRRAAARAGRRRPHRAVAGAWSPRSSTARPAASPIRRASRSPMAARTAIPFPVPTKVYDQTIEVLKAAIAKAKLGNDERLDAIRRLDEQARRLERQRHRARRSPISSRRKRRAPMRMAAAASSAGSPRRCPVKKPSPSRLWLGSELSRCR